MLFGILKNTKDWGFQLSTDLFDSYVEVSDDEHFAIVNEARNKGKLIKGDKDGKPILVDPPKPTEEELAISEVYDLEDYLKATDWYAIRYTEEGTLIPDDIKTKRHNARLRISELKEKLK